MREQIGYFTVCNITYFSKAIVLAESLFEIENKKLIIFVVDRKIVELPYSKCYEVRWLIDEDIPNFNNLAFMYDVTEFSTSVKPLLTIKLFEKYDSVIYLDPDICIYSSLSQLYKYFDDNSILLTPHYINPINEKELDYDLSMMRFGSFNLGFYGVKNSVEGLAFLNWWSERCLNLGFAEAQFGLSVDQKWVSIAPCFFKGIKIIFDVGYNVAFWNLQERTLSYKENKYLVNEIFSLKFFHFSSFNISNPKLVSKRPHKWRETGRTDLTDICEDYASRLKKSDIGFSNNNYTFDYMTNGDYISPTLRRAYASIFSDLILPHNPFESEGILKKFIKVNYLTQKDNSPFIRLYQKDSINYSFQLKFIYFIMRMVLRFLGPNKFMSFSQLLILLSSYRLSKGLWKNEVK